MKGILSNLFLFTAGAAIGSAVTWKIVKTKYEQIAKEEAESFREVLSRRRIESEQYESNDSNTEDDEYVDTIESSGYVNYNNNKEVGHVKNPYVIPPDYFGEKDGYDTESLTYFADGVLVDDDEEIVEDVEGMIGEDSLNHFGEYEDDSVFVRNERLRCDYEILIDTRKFTDVAKASHPNRVVK